MFLISCTEYKTGNGGLLYKIIDDQPGPAIGEVAFVSVSYTEATESGKILSQSGKYDERPAMIYARMPEFKGDFQDALQYLSEGDSAILKVNMDSIRLRKNYHPRNDTSGYMIYHVRVHKVINKDGDQDTSYASRVKDYQQQQYNALEAAEPLKIRRYLAGSKNNYSSTSDGLLYPKGFIAANNSGRQLKVNYTLSSLDGKVYDTNNEALAIRSGVFSPKQTYGPYLLSPENAPFRGFGEAIRLIPEGTKAVVIIPSSLAFGRYGSNKNIPAFCPLLCEFEILNN